MNLVKKTILLFVLVSLSFLLFAEVRLHQTNMGYPQISSKDNTREVLLSESFPTATFPPTGWTVDGQAANWSAASSANAGGNSSRSMYELLSSI